MSVWAPIDDWLLAIQSKYECFGVINSIKTWGTIQNLPSLNVETLNRVIRGHNFNPSLDIELSTEQVVEKSKSVRQASEYYVKSIGSYQSMTDKSKRLLKSVVQASMKNKNYCSLIVLGISPEGEINVIDASCQCTAGLGKKCTHVSAVYYHWHLFKNDQYCPTSKRNLWKVPTTRILGKRTSEIQFRSISIQKKRRDDTYYAESTSYFDPRSKTYQEKSTEKKTMLATLISKMQNCCPDSLFLNFHADSEMTVETSPITKCQSIQLPTMESLQGLCNMYDFSRTDFVDFARKYYTDIGTQLMESTENQSSDSRWHNLRIGLPTASIAHRICTRMKRIIKELPNLNDPRNLLRQILRPSTYQSELMRKGLQMEEYIAKLYLTQMSISGKTNCKLSKCGLKLFEGHGLIGGSVDRLFTCDTEETRVVEIKCVKSIDNHGCLVNGTLKSNHSYFYQLQVNMGVHNLRKSHFVIYENDNKYLILDIEFDEALFLSVVEYCTKFFNEYVLYYLRNPNEINDLMK